MSLQSLRGRRGLLKRILRTSKDATQGIEFVRSASEMERVFQAERARVERKGGVFSIVVLESRGSEAEQGAIARLLAERIRVYDHLGRLDRSRFAVVLPDTDPEGAWIFADDALARLAKLDLRVDCEVYAYPLDWRDQLDPGKKQEGRGEDDEDTPVGGARERLALLPDDASLEVEVEMEHEEHLGDLTAPVERPVGDLEASMVEPLPFLRRAMDVVVSATLLTLLSPILVVVACLVKLTSPGPVFFIQKRAGRGGVPFDFVKFRSMYVDAEDRRAALEGSNEKAGPIFKIRNDPRITPLGRFLRKTSIDELPQLLSVLRGDMTLIGPRPPRLDEVAKYEPWQRRRLDITGGLTCIWQVSGRSEVGFEDWVRMDLEYQRRRSVRFDLGLLWRTVGAVVSGRGAY